MRNMRDGRLSLPNNEIGIGKTETEFSRSKELQNRGQDGTRTSADDIGRIPNIITKRESKNLRK